jgi:uncharacterized protein YjbI with pentapeptide repeats
MREDMAEILSHTQYHDQTFSEGNQERHQISGSEFLDCTFEGCSFVENEFRGCKFVDCIFKGSDLSMIQVSDTSFKNIRFVDCKVVGINWTLADWSSILFSEPMSFENCTLNHSTFIGLELPGLSIVNCAASNVDFRDTELIQSNLSGTDLSDCLFVNTNLKEADLRGAINYHINPEENVLTKAKFALPEAMSLLFNMDIELFDV